MASDRLFKTALLEFYLTENQLFTFLVRSDLPQYGIADPEPIVVRTPLDETGLRATVHAIRADFQTISENICKGQAGCPPGSFQQTLERFQEICFTIFTPELLEHLQHYDALYLVPYGDLHYLPLHAAQIDRNSDERLIDRFKISYLPSASVLQFFPPEKESVHGPQPSLLVGVDHTNEEAFFAYEAQALAGLSVFENNDLLLRKQATLASVFSRIQDKKVIHISSHGFFSKTEASRSGALLYGTPIKNLEEREEAHAANIFSAKALLESGIRLSAEMVTMSGCVTGESERRPGDELIGLTRGLLYAGSRSMIVTLFPTFKNLTGQKPKNDKDGYFAQFYHRWLSEGWLKAAAFQQFVKDLKTGTHHDYQWFSFILAGDLY